MQRLEVRQCLLVRALVNHRVVGVGDRHDPCPERNLLAAQAMRIAGSVEALVMMQHHRDRVAQARRLLEDQLADARVLADRLPLAVRERRRLVQDLRGHGQLAQVVEQARDPHPVDLRGWELQVQGDPGGQRRDHVGRPATVMGLGRQDRCQRLRGGVACPLTDGRGGGTALRRDRRARHRGPLVEVAIEVDPVAAETLGGVHRRVSLVDERVDQQLVAAAPGNPDADRDVHPVAIVSGVCATTERSRSATSAASPGADSGRISMNSSPP